MIWNKNVVRIQNEDIIIPENYNPEKDDNAYMNKIQVAYFKRMLVDWKENLEKKTLETIEDLSSEKIDKRSSEDGDRTDDEVEILTTLRTRDRYRKLMGKIDDAILRIETGKYGYCEKSGEEIGIKRLIARPIATFSIEMQRIHEEDEDARGDAEHNRQVMKFDNEVTDKEENSD